LLDDEEVDYKVLFDGDIIELKNICSKHFNEEELGIFKDLMKRKGLCPNDNFILVNIRKFIDIDHKIVVPRHVLVRIMKILWNRSEKEIFLEKKDKIIFCRNIAEKKPPVLISGNIFELKLFKDNTPDFILLKSIKINNEEDILCMIAPDCLIREQEKNHSYRSQIL